MGGVRTSESLFPATLTGHANRERFMEAIPESLPGLPDYTRVRNHQCSIGHQMSKVGKSSATGLHREHATRLKPKAAQHLCGTPHCNVPIRPQPVGAFSRPPLLILDCSFADEFLLVLLLFQGVFVRSSFSVHTAWKDKVRALSERSLKLKPDGFPPESEAPNPEPLEHSH